MRCPKCRCFIGKIVITKAGVSEWATRLVFMEACPGCGYRPASDAGSDCDERQFTIDKGV
jgi:hypothetical protein